MADDPVIRFAPSPNGRLHLGHALSALVGRAWADRLGGRYLLRIEDIDLQRSRETFVDQIIVDLDWLGIGFDGPIVRQSTRFAAYVDAADRLRALGVLYPCWATRTEIADAAGRKTTAVDPDGVPLYPGLWRNRSAGEIAERLATGEPAAWRIDMSKALSVARSIAGREALTFEELDGDGRHSTVVVAKPERWGDAVIVRKDTPTSYHLAVVVDDAWQSVTHVTRGRDLFAATDLHRLLQVLLGLPAPLYHHHPLVIGADGRKLAKSAGDTALADLRAMGLPQSEIRRRLGFASGSSSRVGTDVQSDQNLDGFPVRCEI